MTFTQLVNISRLLCKLKVHTVFTRARHWAVSWASCVQPTSSHPIWHQGTVVKVQKLQPKYDCCFIFHIICNSAKLELSHTFMSELYNHICGPVIFLNINMLYSWRFFLFLKAYLLGFIPLYPSTVSIILPSLPRYPKWSHPFKRSTKIL
jgi:hypothetical protein